LADKGCGAKGGREGVGKNPFGFSSLFERRGEANFSMGEN